MARKKTNIFAQIISDILQTAEQDAIEMTKDPVVNSETKPTTLEEEIRAREKSYTALTDDFEKNYKKTHDQKRTLKCCFFWIVMPLFVLVVISSLFALIASLFITGNQIEVVVGAVVSLITSIIAIPTIIANYLFPTNEDNDMSSMINRMQNYDKGIRKIEQIAKSNQPSEIPTISVHTTDPNDSKGE